MQLIRIVVIAEVDIANILIEAVIDVSTPDISEHENIINAETVTLNNRAEHTRS